MTPVGRALKEVSVFQRPAGQSLRAGGKEEERDHHDDEAGGLHALTLIGLCCLTLQFSCKARLNEEE